MKTHAHPAPMAVVSLTFLAALVLGCGGNGTPPPNSGTPQLTLLAGVPSGAGSADGTGSAARFFIPYGVAVDGTGNVYVADTDNNTLRKVTPAGVVSTLAGTAGSSGSAEGTGAAARFHFPVGVAVDGNGNVYVADTFNHTIRKVTPAGVVSTLAGTAGSSGSADGTGAGRASVAPLAWRWTGRGTST